MISVLLSLQLTMADVDLPQSPLVDGEHEHEWTELKSWQSEILLLDEAPTPDFSDAEKTYATILLRGIDHNRDGTVQIVDYMNAIDCETSNMAVTQVWEPVVGWRQLKSKNVVVGEFLPADKMIKDTELEQVIFAQVCGQEEEIETEK